MFKSTISRRLDVVNTDHRFSEAYPRIELLTELDRVIPHTGTRIWIRRCDEVAEIEKDKGIDNKDKRKRKKRKDDDDDRDGNKKSRKNEKTNKNSLNEKNTEKLIKLVTRDSLLGVDRSIKNNWGTRVKLHN
ncbi:hypothetical protein RhiirA4_454117 [Rhizophagus irregularis]|uniref:Uncharacterized protein n=1 Tax=Rhizophagus irregularis TaxID=588596 RepID=A0A2I1G255_9GLOM|nr:hypothetical protein RhiirA4_454117 [Rhizophagus irregularis]